MKPNPTFISTFSLIVALLAFGCAKPVATSPPLSSQTKTTVDKVRELASKLLKIDVNTIKPTSSLGELGADDLDFVELIMELEDAFAITIPDEKTTDQATNTMTIQRLANIVDDLKKSQK